MVTPVHIIGLGSPNGLDQVGWRLADQLGRTCLAEYIENSLVATGKCAAPALLPTMVADAGLVLLVDAVSGPLAAGEVCCIDPEELVRFDRVSSSHGISLKEALQLLESISVSSPSIIIFGIGTGVPETGDPEKIIDRAVDTALPVLARVVAAEIRNFLAARSLAPQPLSAV